MIPEIAAIVPAHNEQRTVGGVVRAMKQSGLFSEIIVVSDGCRDRTVLLARQAGAKVIVLPDTLGKGEAMSVGVTAAKAPYILFFDADIRNIKNEHLHLLIDPVISGEADMVIGVQPKWRDLYDTHEGVPVLSGQRAMRREVFEQVPEFLRKGYQIEEALNSYCKMHDQKIKLVTLEGLRHYQKYEKVHPIISVGGFIKLYWEVAVIFVKTRTIRLLKRLGDFEDYGV